MKIKTLKKLLSEMDENMEVVIPSFNKLYRHAKLHVAEVGHNGREYCDKDSTTSPELKIKQVLVIDV